MLVLEVSDENGNKSQYEFGLGKHLLGKGDQCDLILNDCHVSRHHAELEVTRASVKVMDLDSTNGTFLNDKPLMRPTTIRTGDVLCFGEVRVKIVEADLANLPQQAASQSKAATALGQSSVEDQSSVEAVVVADQAFDPEATGIIKVDADEMISEVRAEPENCESAPDSEEPEPEWLNQRIAALTTADDDEETQFHFALSDGDAESEQASRPSLSAEPKPQRPESQQQAVAESTVEAPANKAVESMLPPREEAVTASAPEEGADADQAHHETVGDQSPAGATGAEKSGSQSMDRLFAEGQRKLETKSAAPRTPATVKPLRQQPANLNPVREAVPVNDSANDTTGDDAGPAANKPVSLQAAKAAPKEQARRFVARVFESLNREVPVSHAFSDERSSREEVKQMVASALNAVDEAALPSGVARHAFVALLVEELIGLGPLKALMDDRSVRRIMVNGPDHIVIETLHGNKPVSARFISPASYQRVIENLLHRFGGHRAEEQTVDLYLDQKTRATLAFTHAAPAGALLLIRKLNDDVAPLASLIDSGALTASAAAFLKSAQALQQHMIVTGSSAAARAEFINVMLGQIEERRRCILVEESPVLLCSRQSHTLLQAPRGKAAAVASMALMLEPDWLVVEELAGSGTESLLTAAARSQAGLVAGVQASDLQDAMEQLQLNMRLAGAEWGREVLDQLICQAVDIVVEVETDPQQRLRVVSISAVSPAEAGGLRVRAVFEREPIGADALRSSDAQTDSGNLIATGYLPAKYTNLYSLPLPDQARETGREPGNKPNN